MLYNWAVKTQMLLQQVLDSNRPSMLTHRRVPVLIPKTISLAPKTRTILEVVHWKDGLLELVLPREDLIMPDTLRPALKKTVSFKLSKNETRVFCQKQPANTTYK